LPNVGPYIYDVSISGFTRSSIYIYDISSLRVKVPVVNNSTPNGPVPTFYGHTICRTKVPLTSPSLNILGVRDPAWYLPTATGDLRFTLHY